MDKQYKINSGWYKSKLTEEQKVEIIQLYLLKHSQTEIGKIFKISHRTVGRLLVEHDIPIRSESEIMLGDNNPNWKGGMQIAKARSNSKRYRELGFDLLNKSFKNSAGHHINQDQVIYIPEKLHKSISHKLEDEESMKVVNQVALEWHFEQNIMNNRFNIEGDI